MAEAYKSLTADKFGYVREDKPTTHYTVTDNTWYRLSTHYDGYYYDWWLLAGFPAISSSLLHKKILRSAFYFQTKSAGNDGDYNYIWFVPLDSTFDPTKVTYNNKPSDGSGIAEYEIDANTAAHNATTDDFTPYETRNMYQAGRAVSISPKYSDNNGCIAYINTNRKGSDAHLYWRIYYDDAVNVTSKVHWKYSYTTEWSTIFSLTLEWEYEKSDGALYCLNETWTQASAVLYWRVGSSGSYRAINISGSTQSVEVPKETWPTGSTIQYFVRGTDTDGTTTDTTHNTIQTYATYISAKTYPSGTNVDNRVGQSFSWKFVDTNGRSGYTQGSAALKWRVSGTSNYNTINASGATTSLSVPAYTFPANSTIEWYITGTDYSGASSSTSVATFKTLGYTLTVTTKPNTSNVDTRAAQTFAWDLKSTQGDAAQTSYILYWRVSGAGSYTQIAKTTGTKSCSVAANTFPTGSTIQWYLKVTAKDGTTYQTNAATFTTVSPQITATIYPSGSNIYSGAALKFQWKFTSAVGDYTQTSAKLYWRKSTSDPWTTINASGTTQSITVAANTFPTNATITWYLEGVDKGGHTSQTSSASFSTSTTQITPQSCPTSGYYNPRAAITFQWYFAASGGSIPQGSASLFWKVSTASTYNEIQASGTTTKVTVAANTFPVASLIDWYISGTDKWGVSSTSEVYQFSTTASEMKAIAKSPITGTIDGSEAITFVWTLTSADGFPASRVDLLWKLPSESSSSWHTITSSNSSITEYTVAADYFSPGQINWLVRAWNIDGVQGPDSIASVVVLVAPQVSGVSATTAPWSTISWQANDQQSFQIDVDGKIYGPYFGTEKHFELPDFLRDGVHTIKVRVLGSFNLWSEWEETTVSIENAPGEDITLTGTADVDVALAWETEESTADFYIYRDDVMIGHTTASTFTDRFSIGRHTFTVVNRLADGNYSISQELTFETEVENMHIAAKDGGEWIELVHTIKNNSNPEYSESLETVYNKMSGHTFPAVSASEYMETPIKCTAVFLYTEEAAHARFRKLLGKTVIIKTKDGGCYVCFLASWDRLPKEKYYTAYKFTLRRINWEDFVDDT